MLHSGSWYSNEEDELDMQLSDFIAAAMSSSQSCGLDNDETKKSSTPISNQYDAEKMQEEEKTTSGLIPRGVISPHAGYSYSGSTAAYAYLALRDALERSDNTIRTIVILHPSHHVRLDGCAVSGAKELETPLGNLQVDSNLRLELLQTGGFTTMTRSVDENEHSGEMQYPFIAKILSLVHPDLLNRIKVLPIMVGSISNKKEQQYGHILKPFLSRPHIFTVISSDFCHWGSRFHYTPFDNTQHNEISAYIQYLDKLAMSHIESQDPGGFAEYFRVYSNTICGRHPIAVWLNALEDGMLVKFIRYKQSGQVRTKSESSVSYASAVAWKSAED